MIKTVFLYSVQGKYYCYGNEILKSQYDEYKLMEERTKLHQQNLDRSVAPNDPIRFASQQRPRNHTH